jgi:hypothetical protein
MPPTATIIIIREPHRSPIAELYDPLNASLRTAILSIRRGKEGHLHAEVEREHAPSIVASLNLFDSICRAYAL